MRSVNDVFKFLKEAVEGLSEDECGTWHIWLNDTLELDVGLMSGFSDDEDEYDICYKICVNDDMPDIDFAVMPYNDDGEVWDTCNIITGCGNLRVEAEYIVREAIEITEAIKRGEYKLAG